MRDTHHQYLDSLLASVPVSFVECVTMRIRQSELLSASRSLAAHRALFNPEVRSREVSTDRYVPSCLQRPAGQQLALLKLRRTRYAKECIAVLERGTARAKQSDYAVLIASGLARKHDLGWLVLTATGRPEAEAISFEIAKAFGLHHFRETGGRYQNTVICSCGNFSASVPHFSRQTSGSRDRAMTAHLRQAAAASPSIVPEASDG